ncbi:hypothetical protein B0T14DRAFT_515738 [Immersiella caudata]|uniref:Uncharacterized protein n=1 Tax=Immersiella caudata TaxID=314043 RepID=A0AA39WX50_9PEZI|nr:hypothetical protein B0T14DRAFT_515738 [Immersiella caudata]
MASNSSTVTIDRDYFDTLVRRAKFNSESFERNGTLPVAIVTISQAEHDRLKNVARQYENLRRNLLRGGVGEDTVAILSQDDKTMQESNGAATPSQAETITEDGGASLRTTTPHPHAQITYATPSSRDTYCQAAGNESGNGHIHPQSGGTGNRYNPSWADATGDAEDDDASCDEASPSNGVVGATYTKPQLNRPQYDRESTRTVLLTNLPEGTTHADITNAVRGGMLLDIFLRANERSAAVSFLQAVDARKFFDHVRKHDMYIRNKRIEIKWSDRQFTLPGHVAGHIGKGASRNLVVHRYDGRHTEESIRDDLEHIHNLVVVGVGFSNGSCHIKLNSVHNAIYAKTCMMSRLKYKGTKIEWDVDECAQPYAPVPPKPKREASQPKKTPAAANRFQLLNIDDDDEDEITSTFHAKKSVGITA